MTPTSREALSVMATWVAAIADNVKNPVAGIRAALDHLDDRLGEPDTVRRSLDRVRERLEALNEYITELADFARPAVLTPQRVHLADTVREAVRNAALPAVVDVEIDVSDHLKVRADPAKTQLVIRALLRNAYEAIDAGVRARLRITAEATPAVCRLSVEDNGPGMGPGSAQHAFEPFYTTKEAGTGLGLAVVRKYVEAHGGTVTIERSASLGGCRVVVTLPVDP